MTNMQNHLLTTYNHSTPTIKVISVGKLLGRQRLLVLLSVLVTFLSTGVRERQLFGRASKRVSKKLVLPFLTMP
jgi:hypothetical protein